MARSTVRSTCGVDARGTDLGSPARAGGERQSPRSTPASVEARAIVRSRRNQNDRHQGRILRRRTLACQVPARPVQRPTVRFTRPASRGTATFQLRENTSIDGPSYGFGQSVSLMVAAIASWAVAGAAGGMARACASASKSLISCPDFPTTRELTQVG